MHWLILASALAVAQDPNAVPDVPQAAAPGGATAQGPSGGSPFARLLLMPDISAVGSAALAWNRLDVERLSPRSEPFAPPANVKPLFQELELGIGAVVDPYARADVFLAFSAEGAAVEEASLTTLQLPLGLQARAGQLKAPFGRINGQHAHTWDFIDRPLALARLVGVDGLGGPGLDVAWLAPTRWFAEFHVGYQSLAPGFEEVGRNAGLARLVQFFDLSDGAALGVGLSGVLLDESGPLLTRHLLGADLYLKVRPPRSRSYLAIQGEVVAADVAKGEEEAEASSVEAPVMASAGTMWGGYLQAVFHHGAHLEYGARYERAPALGGGPENRVSALVAWLPSEFQRIRAQLSYDRLPGGREGLEALLQIEFSIGAHGAHPF